MPQNPAAEDDAVASKTHARIELGHPLLKPKRISARRETEYEVHVFVKDDPFVGIGARTQIDRDDVLVWAVPKIAGRFSDTVRGAGQERRKAREVTKHINLGGHFADKFLIRQDAPQRVTELLHANKDCSRALLVCIGD